MKKIIIQLTTEAIQKWVPKKYKKWLVGFAVSIPVVLGGVDYTLDLGYAANGCSIDLEQTENIHVM